MDGLCAKKPRTADTGAPSEIPNEKVLLQALPPKFDANEGVHTQGDAKPKGAHSFHTAAHAAVFRMSPVCLQQRLPHKLPSHDWQQHAQPLASQWAQTAQALAAVAASKAAVLLPPLLLPLLLSSTACAAEHG
jgi:hypothetical protein